MRTKVSLRIIGDALDPEAITRMLGCAPRSARRKGEHFGKTSIAQTGIWSLQADENASGDLEGQIAELLKRLPSDPRLWGSLKKEFRLDLFCGLFMAKGNDGVTLSPETLDALGRRGIQLALDIYDSQEDGEDQ